jgi:hypothetical protein
MRAVAFIFISGFWFLFLSCSKKENTPIPSDINIMLQSEIIYADLLDEQVITVTNDKNEDVTSSSQILLNNLPISGSRFKTSEVKTFTVRAINNGNESNSKTFKAIRHEVNNFTKKVIIEEFAGTWCSFCTRFTYLIDTMVASNNKIIPLTVHSGDPMQYVFVTQMRTRFGISSFPSGYINRAFIWDESADMVNRELNARAKLGIALKTSVSGNNINATVRVKFDISTSEHLNVVLVLMEDGLNYAQANFYNNTPASPFFELGDPIPGYIHNNVLRVAATDIFGDRIPSTLQAKNATWEKSYTLNASGYDLSKLRILAFVQYAENNVSRWGVLNAQVVKVGEDKSFD